MKLLVIFAFLNIAASTVYGARILMVYPFPSKSHYILGNSIGRTLMEAGHDISMVSPYSEKNPPKNTNGSWTEYILALNDSGRPVDNMYELEKTNVFVDVLFYAILAPIFSERTLNDSAVQTLLKSDAKFDLVILEQVLNDAMKGLASHYNAPLILTSSVGANTYINTMVGNPRLPSYIPDVLLGYPRDMTFFERVKNTLFYIEFSLILNLLIFPLQNSVMKRYLPNVPDLSELNYNASLVLLNSHVSTSHPIPLVPAMIEIGGHHIDPPKQLPKDLQQYLDDAADGVIFFSMGSTIRSTLMPEKQKQAIIKVFSKLKQKILWKYEDDDFPEKPANVKISKWFPQQDILAHPNVKLFVTHAGLLSITETIYHGVPVLAIPICADQKINAAEIENSGFGISLEFSKITEELLTHVLDELLYNPKYWNNAQKRKEISHDRIATPRETLVYWVEHVLRHRGTPHLKVSALELSWYQYLLLDVFVFLIVVSVLTIFILLKSFKFIASKCRKQNAKVKTN